VSRPAIQRHYVDALGRRHRPPAATIDVITKAMAGAPAGDDRVLVVRGGSRPALGPAEIRLEDGTAVTIEDRLPADFAHGYHRIVRKGAPEARLIVAPFECYLPEDFRTWGWAIQLYAARSRQSWGIGDLADLARLGRWAKSQGAGIAMINPLAAPPPLLPQQASPYFPSSRLFRNPLFLAVGELPGVRELKPFPEWVRQGRRLTREPLIDRDAIFRLKTAAFEAVWRRVRRRRDADFDRFVREQGDVLRQYATFCAFSERFGCGWHGWPEELRHPAAPGVARLAGEPAIAHRIQFHQWLQYQIDRQLARASAELPVMQDLPIGFDADGADGWAFQDVLAHGISVGAPPDEFNTRGQDWGLPPFSPDKLRAASYEPFAQTIRACLRHAGGLRIDHVMGLFRLFWIPVGREPAEGAYVRSRAEDLLAIVALESQRARAVIVGEDLGTVEKRMRQDLAARRILSYRLVWFEKTPPASYPEQALSAITTHDLPTVAGLWSGADLEAQRQLKLAPNEAGTEEIRDRVRTMTRASARTPVGTVITRLHAALAAAPSRLLTATLEDAMAAPERPNMPATTHQWPNWSIPLPEPIETLPANPVAAAIAKALRRGRRIPDNRKDRRRRSS